ncbi:MAG: crotonase/enoyl-CoA hydratase family protein [Caulobacteraceae bacterium]|nr:crotonase/enoyl-CoA hydratase family protein [Caulobacteraceae bacterium]
MSAPKFETLLYSVEDGIATVTLDRPEKLNAFNRRMMSELVEVFDVSDTDVNVGAVIVTGHGRVFCSGMDLTPDPVDPEPLAPGEVPRDGAGRVTMRIYESVKPVIAAANGAGVGVGATMQCAMDVRLASSEARYGFVFARRGITLEGCSTWFLPRIVGPSTALEWCYSGRIFPAQEALDRGLVRSIHAPDELMPAARALAREFLDSSAAVSVSLTRQLTYRMMGERHPMTAHIYESRALYARYQQADKVEGVQSFLEKRPARFPDQVPTDLPEIWEGWEAPTYR